MKRYCLTLDLQEAPALITEYERLHERQNAWPEVMKSIEQSGIINMEIYRTGNRLFMIMETTDEYDPEQKAMADAANPKVEE